MKTESFPNKISQLYSYYGDAGTLSATIQITENCNLNCSYCYQHNKTNKKITFEQGKNFIDLLLTDSEKINSYINLKEKKAIILEFIGGEPLLEIELIEKLSDYFIYRMIELNHKWLTSFRIQIGTNGTLYFNEQVQKFLEKHKNHTSLSITLDGNQELHDMCRKDFYNQPTYKKVESAIKDYQKKYNAKIGSKLTISPENISFLFDGVKNFIDLGITDIHFNPVFENVWTINDAKLYYQQLKKIIDFIIDNNLQDIIKLLPLSSTFGKPDTNDNNYCGGNGKMIAINPSGNLYPCLRYMESSLGNKQQPYVIGNIIDGIGINEEEKNRLNILKKITKTSQSSKECLQCSIASGCAWCSAFNYETYGTPNKRATFICDMHKARVLAIKYFCNKKQEKYNLFLPKEEALKIISEEEYNYLIKEQ